MSQYTAALETKLVEDIPSSMESAGADALLLERFQRGEDGALVELFDRHNRRLLIYCQKLLGSREQAKDITQELWMRVLRLRGSSQSVANPVGFFLKIARNLCLNHIEARRTHTPLDALSERAHPVADGGRSEMEELILASLERLSFEHREVLVLHIYCGYRLEEIAAMTGKSPEAIWKRASRARKELRTLVMRDSDH